MMKIIVLVLALAALPFGNLLAQDSTRPLTGYAFFAPGGIVNESLMTFHMGAGFEGRLYRGLGAGAELGYLAPRRSFGDGVGVFSANGSYEFGNPSSRKVLPFLTAGYSLGFRSGTVNGANFGGGISYWFADRGGLRVEFRDHLFDFGRVKEQYYGFRLGLTFR